MKIGQKLSLGLLGIVILLGTAGVFGLIASGQIINSYDNLDSQFGITATSTHQIRNRARQAESHLLSFLMLHRESDRRLFDEQLKSIRKEIVALQAIDAGEAFQSSLRELGAYVESFSGEGSTLIEELTLQLKQEVKQVDFREHRGLENLTVLVGNIIRTTTKMGGMQTAHEQQQRISSAASELALTSKRIEHHLNLYLVTLRSEEKKAFLSQFANLQRQATLLEPRLSRAGESNLLQQIQKHIEALAPLGKYLLSAAERDLDETGEFSPGQYEKTIEEFLLVNADIRAKGETLVNLGLQSLRSQKEEGIQRARTIQWSILLVMAITVCIALVFAYFLTNMIATPIRSLQEAIQLYSQGKFDTKIRVHSNDELGQLAASFNTMAANLSDTMVSRSFVSDIIESMPETLFVLEPNLEIKMVNRTATNLLGYSENELIGTPLKKYFSSDCELRKATAKDFAKRSSIQGMNASFLTKGDRKISVLFSVSPIMGEDDQVQEFVCVGKDISELKQAENKLRRSLKALSDIRFALDQTAILVITDKNGTISHVNDKFCQNSGYEKEELLGRPNGLINPELHTEEYVTQLWRSITRGKVWQGDLKNRSKAGRTYWVNNTIVPLLGDEGKPIQYLAIQFDITERKRVAAELLKAKKVAEEHSRSKSQFLAKMSHELRTPLNAILGYCELLCEDFEDAGEEGPIDDLNKIHAAGGHLLAVINDILDLSKVEAGKMELHLENFDIWPVVNQAVTTVAPLLDKGGNQLVLECPTDIGLMKADFTKVKQTLLNLLSNACKFTANGEVSLVVTRTEELTTFAIKDSGIGMSEEQQMRVFDAFTQADSSTTRKYGGTGLGLAICSKFCDMMGGSIEITSELGKGSTFMVTIPTTVAPLEGPRSKLLSSETA